MNAHRELHPLQRTDLVIRGAYLMTMDAVAGDIASGDVRISGGRITAVGPGITTAGAEVIDGRGMILLPGLIDTHTHLWSSQMRGRFGSEANQTYFKIRNTLADAYGPQDMYHGTLLGAAEALAAGITTVVDFCHNNRGTDYIDACLRALKETGIRCRFLFGASTRSLQSEPVDLEALERLQIDWPRVAANAPLSLGLAWRGPLGITELRAGKSVLPDVCVAKEEFDVARRLGLPIAVHVSGTSAKQVFESLRTHGFLCADVQLVHFSNACAEDIRLAAAAGASLALTPMTELRIGYGITQLRDYLEGGMRVGLGIDSNALAGTASLFAVMKLLQLIECGRLQQETAIPARRLLELATLEGARSIGMEREIGSVEVGKRADLIMISTRALNLGWLVEDPAHLLVEAAQPANVDTVIVEGRVLKRGGELTSLDPRSLLEGAAASIAGILERAGA
jgi:5-methylthioadenosine/S-adenosylhomocysteine deaminase